MIRPRDLRVLLVEDQEDDAVLAVRELERAGYRVTSKRVETAAGMTAALTDDWDVVISDFSLPGFNAIGALEVLRMTGRDLPFILTSGTIGEDVASEAMRAGAHDFLVKGRLARLAAAVEQAMQSAADRRARRESEEQLQALAERLAQVNRRLREAQLVAQISYFEIDGETHDVFWSEELWRMCGLEPSRDPAPADVFANLVVPDDRPRMLDVTRRARAELKEFTEQCRINRPGAGVRTVALKGRLVNDESGHRKLVGTVQDITDRTELEMQLRQAQKMEAIGQLAGGVAHDFNNILTVIEGHCSILISEGQSPTDLESLMEIRGAAQRASQLTRQLLTFSRQQVLQPRVLNLNDAIGGMEKMLHRLIGEHIEVHTSLAADLHLVKADPSQMEQVLLNLAVNARDAMPDGGRILIETANVDLDARWAQRHPIKRPGAHVMLAVTDTGTGIKPEIRDRIFDPFYTTKEPGKGTGLGLATVHGIVEQSDGHIWVYSEVGKGTTFKVFLPRCDEHGAAASQPISQPTRGTETLLLVEDDVAVRRMTAALLEHAGYKVLTASSGAEVLRMCDDPTVTFDLVVSDMIMPEMNGRDLVTRVRELRPDIPALLMSGYTRDAALQSADLTTAASFIEKPFTPDALMKKVRDVLDEERSSAA